MFVNEEPSSQECTERGLAARRGYTRWYVYIARILPLLLPQLSVHPNSGMCCAQAHMSGGVACLQYCHQVRLLNIDDGN